MKGHRTWIIGLIWGLLGTPALANSHSWRWREVFTDDTGDIQFLELFCPAPNAGEIQMAGIVIIVVVQGNIVSSFSFPEDLVGSTSNKSLLIGTAAYAALPGAPAPDYVLPADFFPPGGGFTIRYGPEQNYDTQVIAAGVIPTNGVHSLKYTTLLGGNGNDSFVANQANDPTNYDGDTGSVNAACTDNDGDTFGNPGDPLCPGGPQTDCDDTNPNVRPNAVETEAAGVCGDGLDNDCDTLADCLDPACTSAIPECVPTVSEWGVLALSLLTLSAGSIMLRRRA